MSRNPQIVGEDPGHVLREIAFNAYIMPSSIESKRRHGIELNAWEKPGGYIMALSEETRDILKQLKSDDLKNSRVDWIIKE